MQEVEFNLVTECQYVFLPGRNELISTQYRHPPDVGHLAAGVPTVMVSISVASYKMFLKQNLLIHGSITSFSSFHGPPSLQNLNGE